MANEIFIFDIPVTDSPQKAVEIRNNLNALGVNNATANADFPRDPRDGMTRVLEASPSVIKFQLFWGTSWRTIADFSGLSTSARRSSQNFVSTDVWVFDHNLGVKPLVQVILATGAVVFPLSVVHANDNRVIITHTAAQSGTIIVVG